MRKRARVAAAGAAICLLAAAAVLLKNGVGPLARVQHRVTPTNPDTVVIDGTAPGCAECSLAVTSFVTIGSQGDKDIPQRVPSVLRDSRGTHYLVFNGWGNKPILKYDSSGRYIGKLGNYGNGPGEYTMSHTVFLVPGDSVYLFDWNARLQVFGPDGRYVRLVQGIRRGPLGLVRNGSGEIYARGSERVDTVSGKAVRMIGTAYVDVVSAGGELIDSVRIGTLARIGVTPVFGPDGRIWTGSFANNYRLELIGRDGRPRKLIGVKLPDQERLIMTAAQADSVLQELAKRGPALVAPAQQRARIPRAPGKRQSMVVDDSGLLWVMRNVPAPRWDTLVVTPERLAPDEAPEETTIPRDQEDRRYHTIVEVIDPDRGVLLARTSLPFLGMWAAPGYVARVTADASGHYITEVHRVVLNRGEGRR